MTTPMQKQMLKPTLKSMLLLKPTPMLPKFNPTLTPPKKPLCTKEDCRIAERILVREAALCGRSVIETNDEDKIGVLTDFDLAEFVLDSEDETDSENEADDSRD